MRAAISLLIACAALAACAREPGPESSTVPSVSYPVSGNDVAQINLRARDYCRQFGRSPQFQGLQTTADGEVAVYTCGGVANFNAGLIPPAMAGSTVAPAPPLTTATPGVTPFTPGAPTPLAPSVRCTGALHQLPAAAVRAYGPSIARCPQSF